MDYKTTILKEDLELNDHLIAEINGLNFATIGKGRAVFDYTAYFEANDLPIVDYKIFMRTNKKYIEDIARSHNIKTSEIFYQNTNGHILVIAELVFIFLAFANVELLLYFNGLLFEVLTEGVAVSNGFIYSMANQRIPSDVLAGIIKERENDNEGNE